MLLSFNSLTISRNSGNNWYDKIKLCSTICFPREIVSRIIRSSSDVIRNLLARLRSSFLMEEKTLYLKEDVSSSISYDAFIYLNGDENFHKTRSDVGGSLIKMRWKDVKELSQLSSYLHSLTRERCFEHLIFHFSSSGDPFPPFNPFDLIETWLDRSIILKKKKKK